MPASDTVESLEPLPLAYLAAPTDQKDQDHLRLLSIFHYVYGGIALLFGLFPVFHIVFGIMMIRSPQTFAQPGQPPAPKFMGYLVIAMGSCFMLLGFITGGLTLYSARCIRQRRRRLLSLILAGVNCFFVPLGTALGVFTFIVLLRDSVRPLYANSPGAGAE